MSAIRISGVGAPCYTETWPCAPESVEQARELVAHTLYTWDLEDLLQQAELIASELAANAFAHSGSRRMRISISRPQPDLVRVAVADKSAAHPVVKRPTDDAESGRGLLLVTALADRWGCSPAPQGKVVWAELRREATAGQTDAAVLGNEHSSVDSEDGGR